MTAVVIGVDIGTRSVKAVATRVDGTVLAEASRHHDVSQPQPGHFEHDADEVWWAGFRAVVRELTGALAGVDIAAVGLSACGPCVVPVDADGRPLRPGILYGLDTRATAQVEQFVAQWPDEEAISRFGMPFTSQSVAPKLEWISAQEPLVAARTATVLMANGYVAFRLTGARAMDHHQASYLAPLYENGRWTPAENADATRASAAGWAGALPRLVWSDAVVGRVTAAAAAETGLPSGTRVVLGTSDGLTDAVAAGARQLGDAVLRYGSTMGLTVLVQAGVGGPGVWTTPGNRPGECAAITALSTAGAITEWFREELARDLPQAGDAEISDAHGRLIAEAELSPAGANGLLLLPYLAGERTPVYDPDARGVLLGLRLSHTRGDIYRAILEGTAYNLRQLLAVMAQAGVAVGSGWPVRAVGGGTRRPLWPQVVADVCGLAQDVVGPSVGAHLGAARLAAEGVGLIDRDAEPWAKAVTAIRPSVPAAARYDGGFAVYEQLYGATRNLISRLDALSS